MLLEYGAVAVHYTFGFSGRAGGIEHKCIVIRIHVADTQLIAGVFK